MSELQDLHIKHRPKKLKNVVGQNAAVRSLTKLLKDGKLPHVFLFTGPSGTGKTTLSRILAKEAGVNPQAVTEIDAATHTGIDAMRKLTNEASYRGFTEEAKKFIIIDETHQLSKAAWNSLLKDLEDTPEHVYYSLCTTEPGKVPKTIQTRAHHYALRDVRVDDLIDLLESVCEKEKIKMSDKFLSLIARESDGSPRKALVNLSMCRACDSKEEIQEALRTVSDSGEFINIARILTKPCGANGARAFDKCVKELKEINTEPESFRIGIVNYLQKVVMGGNGNTEWLLFVMSEFSEPFNASDKMAPVLIALGNIFLAED